MGQACVNEEMINVQWGVGEPARGSPAFGGASQPEAGKRRPGRVKSIGQGEKGMLYVIV